MDSLSLGGVPDELSPVGQRILAEIENEQAEADRAEALAQAEYDAWLASVEMHAAEVEAMLVEEAERERLADLADAYADELARVREAEAVTLDAAPVEAKRVRPSSIPLPILTF